MDIFSSLPIEILVDICQYFTIINIHPLLLTSKLFYGLLSEYVAKKKEYCSLLINNNIIKIITNNPRANLQDLNLNLLFAISLTTKEYEIEYYKMTDNIFIFYITLTYDYPHLCGDYIQFERISYIQTAQIINIDKDIKRLFCDNNIKHDLLTKKIRVSRETYNNEIIMMDNGNSLQIILTLCDAMEFYTKHIYL
jgi:hypothetical protein